MVSKLMRVFSFVPFTNNSVSLTLRELSAARRTPISDATLNSNSNSTTSKTTTLHKTINNRSLYRNVNMPEGFTILSKNRSGYRYRYRSGVVGKNGGGKRGERVSSGIGDCDWGDSDYWGDTDYCGGGGD